MQERKVRQKPTRTATSISGLWLLVLVAPLSAGPSPAVVEVLLGMATTPVLQPSLDGRPFACDYNWITRSDTQVRDWGVMEVKWTGSHRVVLRERRYWEYDPSHPNRKNYADWTVHRRCQ